MSWLGLLPVAVLLIGLAAVGAMAARAVDQARQLHAELRHLARMRPLVVDICDEGRRLAETVARVRR